MYARLYLEIDISESEYVPYTSRNSEFSRVRTYAKQVINIQHEK